MEVGDLELMRSGLRVAQGEGGLLVQVERPLEGQVLQGLGNLEGRLLEGGASFRSSCSHCQGQGSPGLTCVFFCQVHLLLFLTQYQIMKPELARLCATRA